MIGRFVVALTVLTRSLGMSYFLMSCLCVSSLYVLSLGISGQAHAQDVPGIEICTVEKTMERRTSCLQSNVNFLQSTINKLNADHLQKLDAASRQIEVLKTTIVSLQKSVEDLQAAQKKLADDPTKKADVPSKDNAPAKSGSK
jgi:hypothetical protein